MSLIDDILKKFNLSYNDLTLAEKQTLNQWLKALEENSLSVDKIREYIKQMKDSVEQELCDEGLNWKKDIFLKARLRNYLLLEVFLTNPERAKKMIEKMLENIKK